MKVLELFKKAFQPKISVRQRLREDYKGDRSPRSQTCHQNKLSSTPMLGSGARRMVVLIGKLYSSKRIEIIDSLYSSNELEVLDLAK